MGSKRDNAYFEERMKAEHPSIYADWKAGKYRSFHQARLAAKLAKPRTRLHELNNAWDKANAGERAAFLARIGVSAGGSPTMPPSTSGGVYFPTGASLVDSDRFLLPAVCARVTHIMKACNLKPGQVRKQMGGSPHDMTVAEIVRRYWQVKPKVEDELRDWLNANAHI